MAKVYISSTYDDLKKEREAVVQVVRSSGHHPVYMEKYAASDQRPVDKCLKDVGECDVYVGIFAWRYGHIPDNYVKSITHLEYETAKNAGKSCLLFLLEERTEWPVHYVSKGNEREKIDQLRSELQREYIVKFFRNANELSEHVTAALRELTMAERSSIKFKRPEALINTQLGNYVILENLGIGGKGVVFKVLDRLGKKEKAIKMVPPKVSDSPLAFKHLQEEVNIATSINHPNVVKVLGLEEIDGHFFILMEYIEGKNLEQMLADNKAKKLKEKQVLDLMQKLARGLLETHKKNIIHRDIKPSNIMVTPDGHVKILDFGISYQVTKSMTQLLGKHQLEGTWHYMAPEQLSTRYGRENNQVDIWGFGVTMYQLLSGEFPFGNKDQIKDIKEKPFKLEVVSREIRNVVMKCLEKNRKKRFQNMEEVLMALDKIAQVKIKVKITGEVKEKIKNIYEEISLGKRRLVASSIIVLIVISVFLLYKLMQKDKPPVIEQNEIKTGFVVKTPGQSKKTSDDSKGKGEEEFNKFMALADRHFKNREIEKAREKLSLALKIKQTKETKSLENKIKEFEKKEKEFADYYAAAKKYFSQRNYDKALENISKAEEIKNTGNLKKLKENIQAKIDEKKQKDLENQDDLDYKTALTKNIITAFQDYIDKYPSGRHALEAEKKMRELKGEEKPGYVKAVENMAKKVYPNDKGYWEADYGEGIIMVYIPPGKFTMGSNDYGNEKPLHTVYLDGYWMGKYEVTLAQYKAFISKKKYKALPPWVSKFSPGDDHPVVGVSWYDAVAYCKWFSEKKGLIFKLPTEAQWEKAARGTTSRKYPWGYTWPSREDVNFADRKLSLKEKEYTWASEIIDDGYAYTAPVGSYPQGASPYGLLDMAGNVWEWCYDWYDKDHYYSSPDENPAGPNKGTCRVRRGGSCYVDPRFLRCTCRNYASPKERGTVVGFRICQDNN